MMVDIENSAVVVEMFYYEIYNIARDDVIVFIIIYIKFLPQKEPILNTVGGLTPEPKCRII